MSAEEIKDAVNLEAAPASVKCGPHCNAPHRTAPPCYISKYSFSLSTHKFDLLESEMKDPISKKPTELLLGGGRKAARTGHLWTFAIKTMKTDGVESQGGPDGDGKAVLVDLGRVRHVCVRVAA